MLLTGSVPCGIFFPHHASNVYFKVFCIPYHEVRPEIDRALASRLVHENQVIVLEDLNVRGMVKNSRLAKRIQNMGWGVFREMIKHQCNKLGRYLVVVNRFFPSSKLCHACGYKFTALKAQKYWICPCCGVVHDRDVNAAANLRAEGIRLLIAGAV
ncbi:RNA-guided endonuclease TnpB family protein [Acidithiobacillus ferrivorans]|uniref:RNA-guided endonuclease TnpB family protein n=1 Tax=Acidithiobacillus ferrivorans TaxID=160808 RepID=UPI0037C1577B